MTKKDRRFIDALLEQLEAVGPVRARAMFGGYGIYLEEFMFGLVADDVLYLKVDDENRQQFENADLPPFVFVKDGRPVSMSYYQSPDTLFVDAETLEAWTGPSIAAARRAKQKARRRKPGNQSTRQRASGTFQQKVRTE